MNFKVGDRVWWHYRSAIGHGTITGIAQAGSDPLYYIREIDHHPGEPGTLKHHASALHHESSVADHSRYDVYGRALT